MNSSSPLTLPNALTLLRILAIPFFAIAVWYGHHWQAFVLFAAAGFTDLLDGLIARTFNQSSDLGAPCFQPLLFLADAGLFVGRLIGGKKFLAKKEPKPKKTILSLILWFTTDDKYKNLNTKC